MPQTEQASSDQWSATLAPCGPAGLVAKDLSFYFQHLASVPRGPGPAGAPGGPVSLALWPELSAFSQKLSVFQSTQEHIESAGSL